MLRLGSRYTWYLRVPKGYLLIDEGRMNNIMARKMIRSTPGFFGSTIHRDSSGKIVGKSVPGFFGSTIHKDANGKIVGKSVPGFFGSTIHRDTSGRIVGKSIPGFFGSTMHRGMDGTIGNTRPGFFDSKITFYESDE